MRLFRYFPFLLVILSCNNKKELTGTYEGVCFVPSNAPELSHLITKILIGEKVYTEITFKGKNTIIIKSLGEESSFTYRIDENYIQIGEKERLYYLE